MSTTPEGKTKQKIKALLAKYGAYVFMPVQAGYGAPSVDFLVCHRGCFGAIEAKAGDKQPTVRQTLTMNAMRDAGAKVFLINDVGGLDELEKWLTSF